MDVWNANTTYPNINCYINWIAMPIYHSVSRCMIETQTFSGDATSDFTLNDSVENYHWITFVYRDNDLRMGSTSLDNAQDKVINCLSIGALRDTVVFKESSWKLNKTQAIIQSYGECNTIGDSKVVVKNIHVLAVYGYKLIN